MEPIVVVTTFFAASIRMAIPLALAGLGESISEKSGLLNIGVEAIMLCGAFFSFMVVFSTGSFFLGILAGMLGGLSMSMLHALLSIRFKANQTIVGLAQNFLALGLTSFLFLMSFGQTTTLPSTKVLGDLPIPLLSSIPFIGQVLFSQNLFVYLTLGCMVLAHICFYKTDFGVALHAVGEHPIAADTAGLQVHTIRYIAALFNGILGGLGGAYLTTVKLGFFQENITAGKGYIALVAVILGKRTPFGILGAALVIGGAEALQIRLQTAGTGIPSQLFAMFPYLMTIAALLLTIGSAHDPAALGIPYDRDKR
ncbi:MAG: ABC transporter permease [Sphaerochaeta sp.]|jgi:simple sugar transport system permease protein|nr:ABC transporter permease [Sphaerochaeta sp.]PKL28323.1 MAG: ABC transporter permease [Spirochaetae bacterium HGW-Spirochaetae-2]